MAPLLACLLLAHALAHALAGAGAFPRSPGQRAALPPGLARCLWAGDGECDEPELCPAGSDAADCGALLGPVGPPGAAENGTADRRVLQQGASEVAAASITVAG
eukprot:COSAG04_NODE_1528_length_6453_cov_6.160529_1_plen_103_part_10